MPARGKRGHFSRVRKSQRAVHVAIRRATLEKHQVGDWWSFRRAGINRSVAINEAELQLLLDRTAIGDVQLRYATGVDTRDWALFRACFTDEVEIDSSAAGPARRWNANEWVELVRRTIDGMAATQHIITNQVITIDGDEATCVAYVQARHHLQNETGENDQVTYGYYTNRLVRTAGNWKIRARKLTIVSNQGNMELFDLARRRVDEAEGRGSSKK
jgi:3-phenylpropionate/cinnamic acid dioxygenase small subunit